jgi:hypothetical protein
MREMVVFVGGMLVFLMLLALIGQDGLRITVNDKVYQFKVDIGSGR